MLIQSTFFFPLSSAFLLIFVLSDGSSEWMSTLVSSFSKAHLAVYRAFFCFVTSLYLYAFVLYEFQCLSLSQVKVCIEPHDLDSTRVFETLKESKDEADLRLSPRDKESKIVSGTSTRIWMKQKRQYWKEGRNMRQDSESKLKKRKDDIEENGRTKGEIDVLDWRKWRVKKQQDQKTVRKKRAPMKRESIEVWVEESISMIVANSWRILGARGRSRYMTLRKGERFVAIAFENSNGEDSEVWWKECG